MRSKEVTEAVAKIAAERLIYVPETGEFFWKPKDAPAPNTNRWNTRYAGKLAGDIDSEGYRRVRVFVNNKLESIYLHIVAWYIFYERLPKNMIDHINQTKTDNRIANLREASSSENQRNRRIGSNNKSGVSGVSLCKTTGKWIAKRTLNRKQFYLGQFTDKQEAAAAVKAFSLANGFTELHGRHPMQKADFHGASHDH